MALSDALKNNPAVTAIVAAIIIAASVAMIAYRSNGPRKIGSEQAYYYDLKTGELFEAPQAAPPITAPGGGEKQGVLAVVVACGACDPASPRPAYIQTISEQAHRAIAARPSTPEEQEMVAAAIERGRLVASVPANGEQPQWVMEMSDAGTKIVTDAMAGCSGSPATRCYP